MQKVYLLLRNNKQTGPYSLEELVQLNLKPYDLVWVEGKSAGWRYPGEIDALKTWVKEPENPYVPLATTNTAKETASDQTQISKTEKKVSGKHIFVSLPGGDKTVSNPPSAIPSPVSVQKETDKEPLPDYHTLNQLYSSTSVKADVPETRIARTLNEVEEDYTNWVFKKKKSKKSGKTIGIAAMAFIVAMAGYWGATKLLSVHSTTVATTNIPKAVATVPEPVAVSEPPVSTPPEVTNSSATNYSQPEQVIRKHKADKPAKTYPVTRKDKSVQHTTINEQPKAEQTRTMPSPEPVTQKEQSSHENNTAKKKGIGVFLSTVFGKKKEEEEKKPGVITKSPTTIPDQLPSQRHATHRGESTSSEPAAVQQEEEAAVPSMDLLEVTGNGKSDNWQLGVYDLKLTLHNHNNIPVKSATVSVLYYDENNRLIDKKTISFTNVSARGILTLKAPDQRWADHVDYRIDNVR